MSKSSGSRECNDESKAADITGKYSVEELASVKVNFGNINIGSLKELTDSSTRESKTGINPCKFRCHRVSYPIVAWEAIEFYNKNHPEVSDFELVELVSVNSFLGGFWDHMNFTAKPKGVATADGSAVKSFFAEAMMDMGQAPIWGGYAVPGGKTEVLAYTTLRITACVLLEEGGSSKDGCRFCRHVTHEVHHPLQGFKSGEPSDY